MKISLHPSLGKDALFNEGVIRASTWLDAHNLAQPHHIFSNTRDANSYRKNFIPESWYGCQWTKNNESAIVVNVKKCRVATKIPGWAWTFPGYKIDLTPFGVACHEHGHHVDLLLGKSNYISNRKEWHYVVEHEDEITSWEPSYKEAFAEAFRLFLTNPNLLKEARPLRWEYFTETIGLSPIHEKSWRTVLKHANPKIIRAAERWILDQ